MDATAAAVGGPALRRAWELVGLRPADLAADLGVSRAALYSWARPDGRTPAKKVGPLAEQLRGHAGRRDQARDELLRVLADAASAGRGMTRTDLKNARGQRAGTAALLEELLDGALPMAHVRRVVTRDEGGRSYVREELHPGPPTEVIAAESAAPITPETLRGLRLYAGYSAEGMARRCGCRRQQLQVWESGQVPVPEGRIEQVRHVLGEAVEHGNRRLVDRLEAIDLKQAELARRSGVQSFIVSNAHTGRGRRPNWSHLSRLGCALDEAERAYRSDLEADVDRLVGLVAAAEPDGLTEARLIQARSRGRARGQTGVSVRDLKVLQTAESSRRVQWVTHNDALGRARPARRLHLAGYIPVATNPLEADELRRLMRAGGVSASALAREVGVSFGSAARWTRGERTISTLLVSDVRAALERLAAVPRRDAAADLLAAAQSSPGLPRWQLLQAAGYGKGNRAVAAVLAQLIADGALHEQPRPHHSTVVFHGPASAGIPTRMAAAELRARRQSAGLRQHDLAAAIGVTQTAVASWERAGLPPERRAAVEPLLEPLPKHQTVT